MLKYEVIFCEFCYPLGLSSVQLLRLAEVLKVLVICPDLNVLGGSHEVMLPF